MKARTFIITTGAIFALVAPAAQANIERLLPAHHGVVAHKKAVAKKVSKSHASTSPLYIFVPGPPSAAAAPADDCLSSGNNCTDQQLCDIWGMNCDLVATTSTTDASPVDSAPADTSASDTSTSDSSASDTSSTDSAPLADNSANDSSAGNDNSTLCPGGGVWDADHQYCV